LPKDNRHALLTEGDMDRYLVVITLEELVEHHHLGT
jgi:hypothetical protein